MKKIQSQKVLIHFHLKDQYCIIKHEDSGGFVNGMILWLPADAPKDVSDRINTLTVYVPDRTHIKLKVVDYDLIEFWRVIGSQAH